MQKGVDEVRAILEEVLMTHEHREQCIRDILKEGYGSTVLLEPLVDQMMVDGPAFGLREKDVARLQEVLETLDPEWKRSHLPIHLHE